MNPVDEFLEMKKTAAPSPHSSVAIGNALNSPLGATALTVAGSAALLAMVPAAQKIHTAVTKKRDFKQMMEVNPHLEEVREQDPKMFGHAYNSLRNINPTFGKDPLVAGAYMNKMMMNPEQAGITLAQSVKPPTGPQQFDPFGKTPLQVKPGSFGDSPAGEAPYGGPGAEAGLGDMGVDLGGAKLSSVMAKLAAAV